MFQATPKLELTRVTFSSNHLFKEKIWHCPFCQSSKCYVLEITRILKDHKEDCPPQKNPTALQFLDFTDESD